MGDRVVLIHEDVTAHVVSGPTAAGVYRVRDERRRELDMDATEMRLHESDVALKVEAARLSRQEEVSDAYRIISTALNQGHEVEVKNAIEREHSTLVGKLANVVMQEVSERRHDGRLSVLNQTLRDAAAIDGDRLVSEVRQPLV